MSFAGVARRVITELTPAFERRGFRWEQKNRWFRRRTDGVQHMYYLLFADYSPVVEVNTQVGVRHEAVERIFHRTSGYDRESQATTPTVGGDFAELVPGAPTRLDIGPSGHTSAAVKPLLDSIDLAETYFARFSDLAEIDRDLNSHLEQRSPNRPLPWLRCSTGLIAAKLVGRSDYDRLVTEYRNQLATTDGGFYLGRFEMLVQDLDRHSIGELLAVRP